MKFDNGLEIEICSRVGAVNVVSCQPNKWHVVSINDPDSGRAPIECFSEFCKDIMKLCFHDVDDRPLPKGGSMNIIFPDKVSIENTLQWSAGKDAVLVHCHAGISRSSAVAYLIACTRMTSIEALKILDGKFHWPNHRIVRIGSKILNRPEILKDYELWQDQNRNVAIT